MTRFQSMHANPGTMDMGGVSSIGFSVLTMS